MKLRNFFFARFCYGRRIGLIDRAVDVWVQISVRYGSRLQLIKLTDYVESTKIIPNDCKEVVFYYHFFGRCEFISYFLQ